MLKFQGHTLPQKIPNNVSPFMTEFIYSRKLTILICHHIKLIKFDYEDLF